MHEARNTAQHAGVAPDREQLPAWRDAAVALIDSLCVEAFETQLADIVLASAVRDPELRALLTDAELNVGSDPKQSFSASIVVFNLARKRWHTQRLTALSQPVPGGHAPIFATEESQAINELTGAVQSLSDYLEAEPFAGDAGDYIWFRRTLVESASVGWDPGEEGARRALIFVAGWVVRWEIFTLGYPDEQWEAHRESIEPPTHGDGSTVQITGADANLIPEAPGQPARTVLCLQLANTPCRGRPPWEPILLRAVSEELRQVKSSDDRPVFIRAAWNYSGVLTVHVGLEADGAAVAEALERAVTLAASRCSEHTTESDAKKQVRQSLEEQLRALMAEATLEPPIFGEARVVPDQRIGTLGLLAVIAVRADAPGGDPLESYYVQDAFGAQRPQLQDLNLSDDGLAFSLNEITDNTTNAIRAAIAGAEHQVARHRAIRMDQQRLHEDFASTVRARFGELGDAPRQGHE